MEYIKAADEMVELMYDKLDNFESIVRFIGNLIIGKANDGYRSGVLDFTELAPEYREILMKYLDEIILMLTDKGYDYEIHDNCLWIYW